MGTASLLLFNVFEIILFASVDVRKEASCMNCASADDPMSDVITRNGL